MANYFVREIPKKAIPYYHRNSIACCISQEHMLEINHDIPIRNKAARFAKTTKYPVYGIFHEFDEKIQCLFFFKFVPCSSGYASYICRCLGNRAVRHHWPEALELMRNHMP